MTQLHFLGYYGWADMTFHTISAEFGGGRSWRSGLHKSNLRALWRFRAMCVIATIRRIVLRKPWPHSEWD